MTKTRIARFMLIVLVGAIQSLLEPATAEAANDQPALTKMDITSGLSQMRGQILSALTPQERARADAVRLQVVDSENIGLTRSLVINGTPTIQVGVGFVRMMYYLVDALVSAPTTESTNYLNYVVREQGENARRVQAGRDPSRIRFLHEWSGWSDEQIEARAQNTVAQESVVREWNGVTLFMLAHEYGHHVLNHVSGGPVSLSQSRSYEAAADAWASEILVRLNIGPIYGAPAFLLYAAYDCDALKHLDQRTHPADLARLNALFDASIKALPRLTLASGFNRDQVKRQLEQVRDQIAKELGAGTSCIPSVTIGPPVTKAFPSVSAKVRQCFDKQVRLCRRACREQFKMSNEQCAQPCSPESQSNENDWLARCR